LAPTQKDVTIDLGEPFVLFITFHSTTCSFSLNFNGEALDDYAIVNKVPGMNIGSASVLGAFAVNYLGFTNPGKFHNLVFKYISIFYTF
jgi:hypothetical protein